MKKKILTLVLFLISLNLFAANPKWLEGEWKTKDGKVFIFKLENETKLSGTIEIKENGKPTIVWPWVWAGDDCLYVTRTVKGVKKTELFVCVPNHNFKSFWLYNYENVNKDSWTLRRVEK